MSIERKAKRRLTEANGIACVFFFFCIIWLHLVDILDLQVQVLNCCRPQGIMETLEGLETLRKLTGNQQNTYYKII